MECDLKPRTQALDPNSEITAHLEADICVQWSMPYHLSQLMPLEKCNGTDENAQWNLWCVVQVFAENGDFVEEGSCVLALESMKMEFLVRAQVAGIVSVLSVLPGDHVREGFTLFEVTPGAGVVADAKEVEL